MVRREEVILKKYKGYCFENLIIPAKDQHSTLKAIQKQLSISLLFSFLKIYLNPLMVAEPCCFWNTEVTEATPLLNDRRNNTLNQHNYARYSFLSTWSELSRNVRTKKPTGNKLGKERGRSNETTPIDNALRAPQ